MLRSSRIAWCLVALVVTVSLVIVTGAKHEKVLLKDVTAITLRKTGYTTGRRSDPIPQMNCVGGPCKWAPSTVLCNQVGFDGADALWKCKADLEKGIKLGDISVVCEGFDYPDDPYILRGSCGLEYTLTGQAEVEKNQRYQTGHNGPNGPYQRQTHSTDHTEGSTVGTVFMWLLIAGIAYVLYKACTAPSERGGGGGGGGGGNYPGGYPPSNANPPPYSASSNCAPPQQASSGPGFWSGAGLGGALGYFAGSRNRGYQQGYSAYSQPSYSSAPSYSSSGSSWGSSSSGPSSAGTSTSTAFGGTRRR